MREVRVSFGERSVSASVHGEGPTSVVLGPGAGGTRLTPLLLRVAEAVAASGRSAVLYNFPYSEAGRRAPDPPELLESTARAMADFARGELLARRLVLGGKSMGGRIASQAVAKGTSADGLLFLGYPLHPPGKPEQRREAHLPALTTPMLFVQGTRDAFARFDLLEALLQRLGDRARLFRVEGGDHSFAVPRSSGRARSEVEEDIARAVLRWLEEQRL